MKLIKDNRITRYFAYSTGEIVLVVVGILITLQINNWNQNKQEQASSNSYLTSISKNVQSDIEKLTILSNKRQVLAQRMHYMDRIINFLNE
jgi:Tfp pilus assembly protein PilN